MKKFLSQFRCTIITDETVSENRQHGNENKTDSVISEYSIAQEKELAAIINPDRQTVAVEKGSSSSHRVPIFADSPAITMLAVLALVFALQWAQNFLVPLLLGILIAYMLSPVMRWLERIKVPRVAGATFLMILLVLSLFSLGNSLRSEFQSIVQQLPAAAHKLSRVLNQLGNGSSNTIQQMHAVAKELEKATNQAAGISPASPKTSPAQEPVFKISEWLWAGSMGAIGFVSQATMVLFLVFFLLLSGDIFKRKLVKLAGSSLSKKRITLHILEDINVSVQRYMWMLLVTNSLLALSMWIMLRWIGIDNAGAWAIFAGLLHIIPYFGPLFITIATGFSAFMQFGSFSMMLLTSAVSLAIATFIGMFVTTWMAGRIAKMNAAAVFIGLLFWGWLWGVWGLLLGIPIIVILKVISERVEGLQPFAELLAE
ncbi:MAG TPA: AI-2E family transporter [Burkholderiaceae bacterium]|nr:AI-2E family transporter [Burkholderiaceae bacterium]